ncbi:NAD(P)H-hydrate dehydratase [Notoacmeibacter sp. MSK16QG-6]|uniref:NAD(P)H-hydrate dehydratase n=1 Tax=Notoacmeibacter sp. MSK16QG-6 TaxID=2957982 RepID=UPI00209DFC1F|nr:NAD(P)H-hydrate dehydratase [Notoacmeibacter sp. MSK16QG-6]MCP1200713.1 NAD(P)H-hydrate dehydratase [Notoacmeibacter sp. MSK16QG-6]
MHLLSTQDMGQADRLTIESGVAGVTLMRNAAEAVARLIRSIAKPDQSIQVLCGPGNDGGDGYALGAILAAEWRDVTIYALGKPRPDSDAAWAKTQWGRTVHAIAEFAPHEAVLIVDALFGAGLSRDIEGDAADAIEKANQSGACIVAVDVPSGIGGDDGQVHGTAITAEHTVTFFRGKPGHWLYPGRAHCGELYVEDIGIDEKVLQIIEPRYRLNGPALWLPDLPMPQDDTHKYDRGGAAVLSGNALSTGASRLSARAAARVGAGAITLIAPERAAYIHAVHVTAIMVNQAASPKAVIERVAKGRERALVAGPGYGVGQELREIVLGCLVSNAEEGPNRTIVLDADALTSFHDEPDILFDAIGRSRHRVIMTPHSGEFARLFPDLASDSRPKTEKASRTAGRAGAIVLLKGPDTIIAEPNGRIAINTNGTPLLATAGSGDVLAGMIAGLCAQSMPGFEAACAAVWLHSEAARRFGTGLTADDLPDQLPAVLQQLQGQKRQ